MWCLHSFSQETECCLEHGSSCHWGLIKHCDLCGNPFPQPDPLSCTLDMSCRCRFQSKSFQKMIKYNSKQHLYYLSAELHSAQKNPGEQLFFYHFLGLWKDLSHTDIPHNAQLIFLQTSTVINPNIFSSPLDNHSLKLHVHPGFLLDVKRTVPPIFLEFFLDHKLMVWEDSIRIAWDCRMTGVIGDPQDGNSSWFWAAWDRSGFSLTPYKSLQRG